MTCLRGSPNSSSVWYPNEIGKISAFLKFRDTEGALEISHFDIGFRIGRGLVSARRGVCVYEHGS